MRVAVVGCGAMGSIYAALLAGAGNDVIAVDVSHPHVQAINAGGLRVSGASGNRLERIQAFTSTPSTPVELLIIAVKAAYAGDAAVASRPLVDAATIVLTIQNGLGSAQLVAEALGPDRLIVGVAQGFGASLPEPGHAHHNDMKAIRMGAHAGLPGDAVATIAALWRDAGFDAEPVADIAAMQWEKLICNVAYSAPAALTGMTVGEIMDDAYLGPISRAAATEAFEVARASGVNINVDDPVQHVQEFASRMRDAKPSVLLDMEARRASEVEVINGAVAAQAARLGLSAPVNATLTGLVLALEQRLSQEDET